MTDQLADIVPRAEFRAFAVNFGRVVDEIRQRASCLGIKESREIYLVTAANDTNNAKIRSDQLDIKHLIGLEQGLERWRPILKLDFPTTPGDMWHDIFSALKVTIPAPPETEITMKAFVENVLWPHPDIRLAQVFKRRFFFSIGGCKVEITELNVNGAAIQTVAIEEVDSAAVLAVREELGLTPYENVNYQRALKRIMGLVPMPTPFWQMDEGGLNG